MKKTVSLLSVMLILLSALLPIHAASEEMSAREVVMSNLIHMYQQMGVIFSESEIEFLYTQIDDSAQQYSEMLGVSIEDGYELLLNELPAIPSDYSTASHVGTYSGKEGEVYLPSSQSGDIYYVDLDSVINVLNHVGMYISSTTVIDAAATHGVQYFSITNSEVKQAPIEDGNSAILRLSTSGATVVDEYAVAWVVNNIPNGVVYPYDYDCFNNKEDTYLVNEGTDEYPNWVVHYETDAYNCAELVWRAYRHAGGIDLDSDGGTGVFPDDIRNAVQLTVINDTWDD